MQQEHTCPGHAGNEAVLRLLQDSNTAKALAFNKDVRSRCVTLEGDDFNPSGTLTGAHQMQAARQESAGTL